MDPPRLLKDAKQRLEESFAVHGPLLRGAVLRRQAGVVRQAASELLDAFAQCLRDLDTTTTRIKKGNTERSNDIIPTGLVRDVFSTLFTQLGPGDCQIREALFGLIPDLNSAECRQVVLDLLPSVMPLEESEEVSSQVVDILAEIVQRDRSAFVSVLGCLSVLPLAGLCQFEPFQVALKGLSQVAETELPMVVQSLLRTVPPSEADAAVAWEALRSEWLLLEGTDPSSWGDTEQPMTLVADIVLSGVLSYSENSDNNMLARSFLKQLETTEQHHSCLVIDLVVLLALSLVADYSDSVDRIMDSWVSAGDFPLKSLTRLLRMVGGNGSITNRKGRPSSLIYNRLASPLVRSAIFFLLSPARCDASLSLSTLDGIQTYVLLLHDVLDRERKFELVQCLLHLSREAVGWETVTDGSNKSSSSSRKRKITETGISGRDMRSSQQAVRRLVNSVLLRVAEKSSASILRFKHMLTMQLTSSPTVGQQDHDCESIKDVCRIIARLTSSDVTRDGGLDSSEVIMLLQKLLFSSPALGLGSRDVGPASRVERGLLFASELVRSSSLSKADQECVAEWVLRLLLPTTRRMVDPKVGCLGLTFLEALMVQDVSNCSDVLRHLKGLLSNTGLIQVLQNFEQTPKKGKSLLAYQSIPEEFMPSLAERSKTRGMVFCIAYFLRRSDIHCSSSWAQTATWVNTLVSTYLRLGRERATKGWRSHGWLLAPLEFPTFQFPSHSSSKLALIENKLSSFDVAIEVMDDADDLSYDSVSKGLVELDVRKSVESLLYFALSLWVGIGLSAAVLQNCFADYDSNGLDGKNQTDRLRKDLKLLGFQLLKIHCLRMKLMLVRDLLRYVRTSLDRQVRSAKVARISTKGPSSSDVSEALEIEKALAAIDNATIQSQDMDQRYFSSPTMISIDLLLASFCDDGDVAIRAALTTLASRTMAFDGDLGQEFRSMRLKSALAAYISSIFEAHAPCEVRHVANAFQASHFAYTLRFAKFLVDTIPVLRKGYFAFNPVVLNDGFSLDAIISFAVSVLTLVKSMIHTSICPPHRQGSALTAPTEVCLVDGFCSFSGLTLSTDQSFDSLFKCVREMLSGSDCLPVAQSLLEVLSVFVLKGEPRQVEEVISASWLSLHTIYAATDQTSSARPAFVVSNIRERLDLVGASGKRSFEATIGRLCTKCQVRNFSFSLYRVMLLQHIVLIAQTGDVLAQNAGHLMSLVDELVARCESLESGKHSSEEKKVDFYVDSAESIHPVSPLPFLSADVFEDFFEFLLHSFVGVLAVCAPSTQSFAGHDLGPYVHLGALLHLVRKLLQLYRNSFDLFSRKSAMVVFDASRYAILSAVSQLHECVNWRTKQPLPLQNGTTSYGYDPGSTAYLKNFLDIVGCSLASVLEVCNFWQSRKDNSYLLSKSMRLRQVAERALQSVNRLAAVHNWPRPAHRTDNTPFEDFSSLIRCADGVGQSSLANFKGQHVHCSEPEDDSDLSFCATGNWNQTNDNPDDFSVESLELE